MAPQPIRLKPATLDTHVLLKDPEQDVEIKYTPTVLTRSRKRELAALQRQVAELEKDAEQDAEAAEDEGMRLLCNMLNVLLETKAEGAAPAGDRLYDGWMADDITDDQIVGLVDQLSGVSPDPS